MTIPPFLRMGDKVAIVAPAGQVEPQRLSFAFQQIESWGLKVVPGKNIFAKHFNFSGTDQERLSDLQYALNDPEIKAIFCARGGYGSIRIVDKIDWTGFVNKPKWVIGYSDVTVLHACINNVLNIASIHGPMPVNFEELNKEYHSINYLKNMLFGGSVCYELPFSSESITLCTDGVMKGGNLSLLYALRGTKYDFNTENTILFIEDLGEYYYHIDRIIQNFRLGNKFAGVRAIILGGFSEMKENIIPFGQSIEEIVREAVLPLKIPVIPNFQAGHINPNNPIMLGCKVELKSEKESMRIKFN